jgi:hypothetical protein
MPTIAPAFRGARNGSPGGPPGPARRDGYVRVLDYNHDPQSWENADVNDYATSGGTHKDRRWEEGPTVIETHLGGVTRYYLLYSANSAATRNYAVGYAVSSTPLGPFHKSPTNPILHQNPAIGEYGPGHGSVAASPDGTQLFYVHHGYTAVDTERKLYTDRMHFSVSALDPSGNPTLSIDQATSDRPVPSGVAPYRLEAHPRALAVSIGSSATVSWSVLSSAGARLALSNPLNRVLASVADPTVASVTQTPFGATVSGRSAGTTTLVLTYQRLSSSGSYFTVHQGAPGGTLRAVSVSVSVPVLVRSG